MKYIKILSNSWHVANQGASSHKVVWQLVVSNEATDATVALNSPQRRLEQINTAIAHKVHVYISLCTVSVLRLGHVGIANLSRSGLAQSPGTNSTTGYPCRKMASFPIQIFLKFFYNSEQPHLSSIKSYRVGKIGISPAAHVRTCMRVSSVMASPNGFTRLLHAASREQQTSIHLECENEY